MFQIRPKWKLLGLPAIGTLIAVTYALQPAALEAQPVIVIETTCPSGTEATYFGCMVPPPPGVNYVKNWGALAYAESTRQWVFATGHKKEASARKSVLDACKRAGQSCQPYLTFLNQCVSIARVSDADKIAPGKETIHNGSTYEETKNSAVSKCRSDWGAKSCSTVSTQCSINRIER